MNRKFYTLLLSFFTVGLGSEINAQEWSTFFTFSKEIKNFAVSPSGDEFAIYDGQKLFIKNSDGKVANFTNFSFTLQGFTFSADMSKISDMRYISDYLHVATSDSLSLMFYDEKFVAGLPSTYIYDCKSYQGDYIATCNLFGKNYFAVIDVEDAEFDPWVCVTDENAFAKFQIGDLASTDRIQSCIHADNTILNTGNGDLIVNTFDMTKLPFKRFKEIEWSDIVYYKIDGYNRSRMNLWAMTDNGLALYISEIDYGDFGNWKEENWRHLNKDNSWLRSNKIEHLESILSYYKEFFIVYSNEPTPTVYFFDPKGEKVCIFDKTNSILSGNLPITNIYVNTDDDIYLTQGTKIIKLEIQYDMSCLKTSSTQFQEQVVGCEIIPNPTSGSFKIIANDRIKIVKIYSTEGYLLRSFTNSDSYFVDDLKSGVYIINIELENGLKKNMRIIKY
jgi:hypothetical protein